MGHIINKIRRQQRTALLNRDAMEREQRRQQGYPTAFPMLDGQGGISWIETFRPPAMPEYGDCSDSHGAEFGRSIGDRSTWPGVSPAEFEALKQAHSEAIALVCGVLPNKEK